MIKKKKEEDKEIELPEKLARDLELARQALPTDQLGQNLLTMLADFERQEPRSRVIRPAWLWAAAALFLLLLSSGGFLVLKIQQQQAALAALAQRMDGMRQTAALSLLKSPVAAERITGVSYMDEVSPADRKIAAALLATLDNDPNVNVRLSALDALLRFGRLPEVRSGLVDAIGQQDSPLVQLAIADVVLQLQDKEGAKALRRLLERPELDPTVRQKINSTLKTL